MVYYLMCKKGLYFWRRLNVVKLACLVIASLILGLLAPLALTSAQENTSLDAEIERLMAEMTPADKVGQLFLVSFPGSDVGLESDIADLIINYRVGGVVLSTANENISNIGDTPVEVASLCNGLQALAYQASITLPEIEPLTPTPEPSPFIPLIIAIDHEGNGYPYTSLINGFTPIPSNMAIGATWNPENARLIGQIVGRELKAVGVNMLLGPSLDVLDRPRPSGRGDLGIRTFGGDPFWVGEMGKAYIKGVHEGAQEVLAESESGSDTYWRVAVIAKHFPGHGGSDRGAEEEVAVVDKSLEELKRIELAPFFAVMLPDDPESRTDGILTAHIQYRGFQGNIREKTKPISLDAAAMSKVLNLAEIAPWRAGNGIIVSDSLGAKAVQKSYDPYLREFNGRQIARDAFLAGNDLLRLSQYGLWGVATWEAQLAEIKNTITYFQTQYEQDSTFRDRVDESVRRILRLKLQMYPEFRLESTQVDLDGIGDVVGQGQAQVLQIAQQAITLISPRSPDFLPPPPGGDGNIVIFTDDRRLPDGCPAPICQLDPYFISRQKLEETILKLYGPGATNQIRPTQVQSFTFTELALFLARQPSVLPTQEPTATPLPNYLEIALNNADWIVFAMLDIDKTAPNSNIVKQFLDERDDLARAKRVVVMAYNRPYYLDETEISKLKAYYGVYSRMDPFIEASIRALFGEGELPHSAPPVSVEGVNYYLLEQTEPDPDQVIDLTIYAIDGESLTSPPVDGTPSPTPVIPQVGQVLTLRTGVILDHNGHLVPDGTPVEFLFSYPDSPGPVPKVAATKNGIAEIDFTLDRPAELKISVRSGAATKSTELTVGESVQRIVPTPEPPTPTNTPTPTPTPTDTPTPTPTPTATATPVPTPTLTPTPIPTPSPLKPIEIDRVQGPDLVLLLVTTSLLGGVGFVIGRNGGTSVVIGLRVFLWSWILSLAVYSSYGLGILGSWGAQGWPKTWSGVASGIVGSIPPLAYIVVCCVRQRALLLKVEASGLQRDSNQPQQ